MTGGNSTLTSCDWEYAVGGGNYYIPIAIAYVVIVIILFTAIAIVCDDYFVPSLEVICKRLDLSEDVAGATFMAAGSSAPELFTSLAAVTNSSDIGVGTIVGSAVFNILIIISLSAILSKNVLLLDWRPLSRDAFFYGISIIMFSAFAWDGMFTWVESTVTLVYYFLYILTLKFNKSLFRLLDFIGRVFTGCGRCCRMDPSTESPQHTKVHGVSENSIGPVVHITPPSGPAHSEPNTDPYAKGLGVPIAMMRTQSSGSSGIGSMTDDQVLHTEPEEQTWRCDSLDSVGAGDIDLGKEMPKNGNVVDPTEADNSSIDSEPDEIQICCFEACPKVMTSLPEYPDGGCRGARYCLSIVYFTIAFPFQLLFSFTIPNSTKPHLKKYYLISFTGSVVWIALLSYTMVLVVEKFGCIVGFNDYVMGLVVVAAGTSVPDALSSVIVAREGHGDMAVSNALGSNVFDINLGLGLPFLIKTLYQGGPLILMKEMSPEMVMAPHFKFGIILLLILLFVYSLVSYNKFRLTRSVGFILMLMYVVFIAYALIQELLCDSGRLC